MAKFKNSVDVIYDNVQALSKDGLHMFYCTRKLASSYLRKGLAEMVSEDPFVFRLVFEAAGAGCPTQAPKRNNCECCDTDTDLSKHHVIPYEYRRWFPLELKSHRSHEHVVPLCRKCHDEYEVYAFKMRYKLNFMIAEHLHKIKVQESARRAAKTLRRNGSTLPDKKTEQLRRRVAECTWSEEKLMPRAQYTVHFFGPDKLTEMWMQDYRRWLAKNRTVKKREARKLKRSGK
jgi:hypothetical protein